MELTEKSSLIEEEIREFQTFILENDDKTLNA